MKKIKKIVLCMALAAGMLMPATVSAADRKMDSMGGATAFELTGGKSGKKVTKLSSGEVSRDISTDDEFWDCLGKCPVSLFASMDGKTDTKFYWSEGTYKKDNGKAETVAVLKADKSHTWSKNSNVVIKVQDLWGTMCGIEVEMGASAEGPRDYKISYSLDQGKTWKKFNSLGTDKGSVTTAGNIGIVFKKNIANLKRTYEKHKLTSEYSDGGWDVKFYDDVYFKISVNSDYKVNGKKGIYGSKTGEWGIRSVRILQERTEIDDPVREPTQVEAYKTASKTVTVSWEKSPYVNVDGFDIYLKKGNGNYKKVKTVKSNKTQCAIKNLSAAGKYKFRMRSFWKDGGKVQHSSYTRAATVNMKKQPLLKNVIVGKSISIKTDQKKNLTVKCTKETSSSYIKSIRYKVKNPKVATIDSYGTVTGKKEGTTTATVTVILKSGLKKTLTTKLLVKN